MKGITLSVALGLASVIPTLAAPGWIGGGEGRDARGSNNRDWDHEGWDEAKNFHGWGQSSPFKPGFSKPGSPSHWGPTWSGSCGGKEGKSCDGSWAGQCCSKDGQCGSTNLHCGEGCQPEFGKCAPGQQTTPIIAPVPSSYAPSSYSSIVSSLSSEESSAEVSTVVSHTTSIPSSDPSSTSTTLSISSALSHVSRPWGNFSTSHWSNHSTKVSSSSGGAISYSQAPVTTTAVTLSSAHVGGSTTSSTETLASSPSFSGSSIWSSAATVPTESTTAPPYSTSAGSTIVSSIGSLLGSSAISSNLSTIVTTVAESSPSSTAFPESSYVSSTWSTIVSTFTKSPLSSPSSTSEFLPTSSPTGSSPTSSVWSTTVSSPVESSPTTSAIVSESSSAGASLVSSTVSSVASIWSSSSSGYHSSLTSSTGVGSSAGSVTTGLSGVSSNTIGSSTAEPSDSTPVSSWSTVVSTQTLSSVSGIVSSISSVGATSIVTSPTVNISIIGSITSSVPITTPGILPNTTTSLNITKPSNTTSACTTKPTPMCIPCEGAPDPTAPWCGYDVNTDFYKYVPRTCKTVEYEFVITSTTISPDGVSRVGLLVNGQMPGPAIEANWGDTVIVRLTNNLPADSSNGTSLHFHGLRQNYTNEMDGVPSITQCPLAPGESMTYKWEATQYGTSWYHSHFQLQAWEGVFGPIVIHGPSSADYDIDLGPFTLQDWSHQTVDEMYDAAQDGKTGGPRVLDTGLINGLNVWGADGSSNQTGKRYQLEFVPGKKHLLRIVNTAIQSTFKFYIDNHNFQVISTDFVPIKPYTTNILNINIGQRYDIIVEANQPVADYWMRADNQDACAVVTNAKNIKAIVHYAGGPGSTPTSVGYNYTSACVDEPLSSLVPVVPYTVGASDTEYDETVVVSANNSLNLYRWYLYGTTSATPETFQTEWSDPTLYEIWKNDTVPPYSGGLALKVPKLKEWVYIVIESPIPLPHPIHLHGHDFYILGSGSGTYDAGSSPALNLNNPPRRDVALLPTAGYLVLAFQTDNPGVWLMHCHIGWHTSMGFAMQIVEAQDLIKPTIDDTCLLDDTCKSWRKYASSMDLTTPDSGV